MHPIRHMFVRSIGFATAVALFAVLGAVTVSASEVKPFTGEKLCHPPIVPTGTCTITSSSLKILDGATIYLTNDTLIAGVLDSPVTLVATDKRASTATGHCTYYLPTPTTPGHGLCTYWAGTGKLAGFHATEVSGPPTPQGVSMTGTYWFDRDHEGDENNGDD